MFLYQISKFHFQIIISKLFLSLITFEFSFHINFSSNFHRKGNFFIFINSSYIFLNTISFFLIFPNSSNFKIPIIHLFIFLLQILHFLLSNFKIIFKFQFSFDFHKKKDTNPHKFISC